MLGITKDFKPRFLRRYADLHTVITKAVGNYVNDIKAKDFPNQEEKY
jgi:3-methyl-2-oxobutanoate hydroxymethyltransferase